MPPKATDQCRNKCFEPKIMSEGGPLIAVENEDASFEQDLLDNADDVIDVDNEREENQ